MHINNATLQQCPHHGIIGTLLGPPKGFQDMVHHHHLVPELVIQGSTHNPVVVLPILHHCQINPLKTTSVMGAGLWSASPLSEPSTQMSMVSLFGMVPARLEPSTGLLGLVRYLRVVSWSKG